MGTSLKRQVEKVTMKKSNPILFHSLEVCFCGYSGSGKTTLVTKLIAYLSKDLRVGYVKHDAHRFEMDKEGKDTFEAKKAGAFQVSITNESSMGILSNLHEDRFALRSLYLDCDVVLVEGHKKNLSNKLYVYSGSDQDDEILKTYKEDGHNLLAIVGTVDQSPVEGIPYFHRDDVISIVKFLMTYWANEFSKRPLYGLVLGGGRSTRMGEDKGQINYRGVSQVEYLHAILNKFVDKCFVSCRNDQTHEAHISKFPKIVDRYFDFGPTGGILSAFHENPNAAWLVVACDMPFVEEETISDLVARRNPFAMATCYKNDEKGWPEPLCTIYEPKASTKLGIYLAHGKPCPRKVLMNSKIELLSPINGSVLNNVNTLEQLKEVSKQLEKVSYES